MFTRRTVLAGSLAGAGVASVGTGLTWPAAAAGPADRATILANVVAYFGGTSETNTSPALADKLASIDRVARAQLAKMDSAGDGELFAGLGDLDTNDPNLANSFLWLTDIALGTVAPRPPGSPSDLEGNTEVQDRVLDGLQWLYDHYYGDQSAGYFGNWYHWEIGIPRSISRILAYLHDRVQETRPELVPVFIEAMDGYLRNGKDGDVDLDSRFHTGANLADITSNRVIQGAVAGDDARITKAVNDQLTVYAVIDPYHLQHNVRDGVYKDGSFIQHESVAYTGSYGLTLLSRVTQTLALLTGTEFMPGSDLPPAVHGWIANSFAPLIYEGWMTEVVRGRAVSRTGRGYSEALTVLEAAVAVAGEVGGDEAAELRAYVKHLATVGPTTTEPSQLTSPANAVAFSDILGDDSVKAADLNPRARTSAFNAMDRHVHRRPGWAFAVSRNSSRISKYEYMNGENLLPWFQGEGAHYLYLAGQDQGNAHGLNYFVAVPPHQLSGVTAPVEERKSVPELYGERWYENPDHPLEFTSSSESQNKYVYFPRGTAGWSGGATLGVYGICGMVRGDDVPWVDKQQGILPDDFVAYQNCRATTSWIMLDDEIVILNAGVADPAGRAVTTTLDSRIAGADDSVEVTDRRRDGWFHYANATAGTEVGYALLEPADVDVQQETVTKSLRVVRLSNPNTQITQQVFGLVVHHAAGASEPGSSAYAIMPGASAAQVRQYRKDAPVEVMSNSADLQAVHHRRLQLTAVNSFGAGRHRVSTIEVDGAASVVFRRDGGGGRLAISDPTMDRATVSVQLRGPHLRLAESDPGVTISHGPGSTTVTADTRQAYGRSFTATLR